MSNISSPADAGNQYLPNLFLLAECHPAFRARRRPPTRRAVSRTTALPFGKLDCSITFIVSLFSLPLYAARFTRKTGGGERDRTDDLLLAKQALSQLSYTPISEGSL